MHAAREDFHATHTHAQVDRGSCAPRDAGSDNGCGAYRANFPLHVAYSGTQLAFTDEFLKSHPQTLVVSIDIGANDLFVLATGCSGNAGCIQAGLPGMLATLSANLDTIYGHIRNNDGYHHRLVALTY